MTFELSDKVHAHNPEDDNKVSADALSALQKDAGPRLAQSNHEKFTEDFVAGSLANGILHGKKLDNFKAPLSSLGNEAEGKEILYDVVKQTNADLSKSGSKDHLFLFDDINEIALTDGILHGGSHGSFAIWYNTIDSVQLK